MTSLNDALRQTIDWYWQFGAQRDGENAISINWLDRITQIQRRNDAIARNLDNPRACLAVWGPSQSGKSTLISDAIDGPNPGNGVNSALTWTEKHPALFCGDAFLYPETVIFNPYNGGSDASGVPTRYFLADEVKHPDFPVRLQIATRAQVMLALAIGYLAECRPTAKRHEDIHVNFDRDSFDRLITDHGPTTANEEQLIADRQAVELMQDLADVIAIAMLTQNRYKNLRQDWTSLRAKLLGSNIVSSFNTTRQFVCSILWDSDDKLNSVFARLCDTIDFINEHWQGKNIYSTLKTAKHILNINTLEDRRYAHDMQKAHAVDSVNFTIEDDDVLVDVNAEQSCLEISGDNFGLLQSLVNELQVPLKRQTLVNNQKEQFLKLLDRADYLDFPGVPLRDTGQDAANLITLNEKTSDNDLFTRVIKQGKTLSMVFMHTREYGIDSFIILSKFDTPPRKTAVLGQGIKSWLQAYAPDWEPDKEAPLKFFLNLTFFANEANKAQTGAIQPNMITAYAERITQFDFVTPKNVKTFLTTYPKFAPIQLDDTTRTRLLQMFCSDQTLKQVADLKREDFEAVFQEDGGVGYLFDTITASISTEKRIQECKRIQEQDAAALKNALLPLLPRVNEDNAGDHDAAALRKICANIEQLITTHVNDTQEGALLKDVILSLGHLVRHILDVPEDILDPVPKNACNKTEADIRQHLDRQFNKWCEIQIASWEQFARIGDQVFDNFSDFLRIMRSNAIPEDIQQDKENLIFFLKEKMGYIVDTNACYTQRKFLAIAMTNTLLTGNYLRKAPQGNSALPTADAANNEDALEKIFAGENKPVIPQGLASRKRAFCSPKTGNGGPQNYPHYCDLIAPFCARLQYIAEHVQVKQTKELPGEKEIADLFNTAFNPNPCTDNIDGEVTNS